MQQKINENILPRGIILIGIIGFGAYVIYAHNLWAVILAGDRSYLSLVILALWSTMSIRWLYLLRWLEKQNWTPADNSEMIESEYARKLNHGWFAADLALKIGLLGTIIGFILMLASIRDITGFDTISLQTALKEMSAGMAVALYTTLAGLTANILLRIQFQILADAMYAQLTACKEKKP